MSPVFFTLAVRQDLAFWEHVETPEFAIHLTWTLWLIKHDFLVYITYMSPFDGDSATTQPNTAVLTLIVIFPGNIPFSLDPQV